jgi:tRNA dimethylallyltransferase
MKRNAKKTVLIIAGPTAVGKTAVAIVVAKKLNAEIISADSRQCYRELHIGVARPSAEELAQVPHHFIGSHAIAEKATAATFEQFALQKTHELFKKSDVVVMTGGTGLYLKAFCDGLDVIPEIPEALHQQIITEYKQNGLAWLQEQVQQLDPLFHARGEIHNPQRLMRALEVCRHTGQSIETYKKGTKADRDFRILKTALHLPKEALHRNINARVDAMIERGLIEEVKSLLPYQHFNALQTVGYKEIFSYLNGDMPKEEAIGLIKQNTRRYAKRQLTWFRKDESYNWFLPEAALVMGFFKSVADFTD